MSNKRMDKYHNNAKKTRNKKNTPLRIVIFSLTFILLFCLGGFIYYGMSLLNSVSTKEISKDNTALGIDTKLEQRLKEEGKHKDIINIALFGTDQRDKNEVGRSDAVMILTIDKDNKKIKLSSIMRDSYVDIDGHGKDKLTHAYAYGGPQLAIKTLNKNYNLNIKDYATVNFYKMQDIIDAVGGVELNITKEELAPVNGMMTELAELGKYKPPFLTKAGVQTLNGKQALAYTRTRFVGNGDFDRSDRQRNVINALFNKIKTQGPLKYPAIMNKLLPMVETSLSKTEIITTGTDMLSAGVGNLEQERFPVDGYFRDGGQMINGVWYLPFDQEATKDQMYKYIFDDVKPIPKK